MWAKKSFHQAQDSTFSGALEITCIGAKEKTLARQTNGTLVSGPESRAWTYAE